MARCLRFCLYSTQSSSIFKQSHQLVIFIVIIICMLEKNYVECCIQLKYIFRTVAFVACKLISMHLFPAHVPVAIHYWTKKCCIFLIAVLTFAYKLAFTMKLIAFCSWDRHFLRFTPTFLLFTFRFTFTLLDLNCF